MPIEIDATGNITGTPGQYEMMPGLEPVYGREEGNRPEAYRFQGRNYGILPEGAEALSGSGTAPIAYAVAQATGTNPGDWNVGSYGLKYEGGRGAAIARGMGGGQQAAMAQNRWLLTTPGYGIGVQTSKQRQGPIYPGTMSPGRTPGAIAKAQGRPAPARQQAARPPDNRGGPGMSVAARQGLYPMTGSSGSSRAAQPRPVTYVPPGVRASTNAYTHTPTQNGMDVSPPGVDADPTEGQFDSWTNQPLTMDDMTQAIYDAGY